MARFVKLATMSDLPAGSGREFEFEGRIFALFNVDGIVSAIDGNCPHQGGPLADGVIDGCTVICPWHGWRFDFRTGASPLGAKVKHPVYAVKIENDDILVEVP